jgi:hypothetical protein
MIDGPAKTCQWIGAEQKEWPYTFCGQKSIEGKSYCAEHYHKMYKKGSSATGAKKMEKLIEKELAELELHQLIAEQEADQEEVNV